MIHKQFRIYLDYLPGEVPAIFQRVRRTVISKFIAKRQNILIPCWYSTTSLVDGRCQKEKAGVIVGIWIDGWRASPFFPHHSPKNKLRSSEADMRFWRRRQCHLTCISACYPSRGATPHYALIMHEHHWHPMNCRLVIHFHFPYRFV